MCEGRAIEMPLPTSEETQRTLKKTLRAAAHDITNSLVGELGDRIVTDSRQTVDVEALLQRLAEEVADQLVARGMTRQSLPESSSDEDDDEARPGDRLPNLKYAGPKYKDVESVLKYIEQEDDKGGVKLVIINFND